MISNTALILTVENGTIVNCQYPADNGYATPIIVDVSSNIGSSPTSGVTIGDSVYIYW